MRLSPAALLAVFLVLPSGAAPADLFGDGEIRLIVRCDDIGMNHATNMAFERVAREGIVTAASVLVTTPWLGEAVEILRRHPEISAGVHLCLNAEWLNYRWGPVTPWTEVPSLVDEWGHFWPTRALFNEHRPRLEDIERELRAQVDLALRHGLRLAYIDHHMGTAGETPERQDILERIARDHGIGISRWYGETQAANIYSVSPEAKTEALLDGLAAITEPGLYLAVMHVALDHPEMAVLQDAHPWAPSPVSAYRAAETEALCDPRLRQIIDSRGIRLVGYNTLRARFLDRVRNPNFDVPAAPR